MQVDKTLFRCISGRRVVEHTVYIFQFNSLYFSNEFVAEYRVSIQIHITHIFNGNFSKLLFGFRISRFLADEKIKLRRQHRSMFTIFSKLYLGQRLIVKMYIQKSRDGNLF